METVGKLTVALIVFLSAFFVSLLGAHVILRIGHIYEIGFITAFSFAQVYGIMCAFNVLKYKFEKTKDKDKKEPFNKVLGRAASSICTVIFFYLFSWLVAYLMSLIIL